MSEIEAMLNESQVRVLASLMEKQMTTPDYYPLTLNALVAACNQKSSRNPVMNLSPQQVVGIINELRHDGLATANTLGRADRFEQQLSRKLQLDNKQRAILCVLMLRGALTVNEIKINTNRMVEFADHEEITACLQKMMSGEEALVIHIPRTHGQREDRYNHLLCGMPEISAPITRSHGTNSTRETELLERIAQLEAQVESLQNEIEVLKNSTPAID